MGLTLTDECDLLSRVDRARLGASGDLSATTRGDMGQFLTPAPIAKLMASMFRCDQPDVTILDPGAGIGSLFAALTAQLCSRELPPSSIRVIAYEIEPSFQPYLRETVSLCNERCGRAGINFEAEIYATDFIRDVAESIGAGLFGRTIASCNAAILNPPYRKISSQSAERAHLRHIGVETSNMYTGFLAAAMKMLVQGGELVAITPRSFCNGPYFRTFREMFLRDISINRVHLFESRDDAFRDDCVLQETVIVCGVKTAEPPNRVTVSTGGPVDEDVSLSRTLDYSELVHPGDPEQFIRVVPDANGQRIASRMSQFGCTLSSLGLTVSTGRVVDFRAKEYLRDAITEDSVPLIYPSNMEDGRVIWPKPTRKAQALAVSPYTDSQLVPRANYVLVKRFTSKEQTRRIVASVLEGGLLPGCGIAIENHINYFHERGRGLDMTVARGLSVYLNSTIVDEYFRQFNGHTQVNATDLRSLRYPSRDELCRLGAGTDAPYPDQKTIDRIIEEEFFHMPDESGPGPVAVKERIGEALDILRALGFPRRQINERSALTLLALLDLTPSKRWSDASNPLRGITPMMDFMDRHYGKHYAPNSRETVRRQTVHQFLEASLIVANPDDPDRPTNSGLNVYQIEESALELIRTYDAADWRHNLRAYLESVETLQHKYAQLRQMSRIEVVFDGHRAYLTPGGQNVLVKQIIDEFAARYTPGGKVIYLGDTGDKFAHFDERALLDLGVSIEKHDKMPDLIIYYSKRNWLVLVEAVTSHGPIDPKRKSELFARFSGSTAGLVLVTAFLTRRVMTEYLDQISWETEVWVADSPDHLIHFNGERFLGPYG
jgi:adenine-specific DNA-methyltransferase